MPNIVAARPVAGQPIETAWGDQVHDAIEGLPTLQFGIANVPAGVGNVTVTLPAQINTALPYAILATVVRNATTGDQFVCNADVVAPGLAVRIFMVNRSDGGIPTGAEQIYWTVLGTLT